MVEESVSLIRFSSSDFSATEGRCHASHSGKNLGTKVLAGFNNRYTQLRFGHQVQALVKFTLIRATVVSVSIFMRSIQSWVGDLAFKFLAFKFLHLKLYHFKIVSYAWELSDVWRWGDGERGALESWIKLAKSCSSTNVVPRIDKILEATVLVFALAALAIRKIFLQTHTTYFENSRTLKVAFLRQIICELG